MTLYNALDERSFEILLHALKILIVPKQTIIENAWNIHHTQKIQIKLKIVLWINAKLNESNNNIKLWKLENKITIIVQNQNFSIIEIWKLCTKLFTINVFDGHTILAGHHEGFHHLQDFLLTHIAILSLSRLKANCTLSLRALIRISIFVYCQHVTGEFSYYTYNKGMRGSNPACALIVNPQRFKYER